MTLDTSCSVTYGIAVATRKQQHLRGLRTLLGILTEKGVTEYRDGELSVRFGGTIPVPAVKGKSGMMPVTLDTQTRESLKKSDPALLAELERIANLS